MTDRRSPEVGLTGPLGVVPPCVTFFDERGNVDEARTRRHVDWLIDAQVDGLLGVGTCGEFTSLSIEEREDLTELLVECAAGRIPVLIGVMHTATSVAVRLARHAEAAGAAAVVGVAPYYSGTPEREAIAYFRDLKAAVQIPLVVYNNPAASGVSLSVATLADLAGEGTAAGIKESRGDPARIHDLRLCCPRETIIPYGEDYGSFEALMVGADGWTAGVANFMPRHAVELWRLARDGDVQAVRQHWFRMLPLVNTQTSRHRGRGRVGIHPPDDQLLHHWPSARCRRRRDARQMITRTLSSRRQKDRSLFGESLRARKLLQAR